MVTATSKATKKAPQKVAGMVKKKLQTTKTNGPEKKTPTRPPAWENSEARGLLYLDIVGGFISGDDSDKAEVGDMVFAFGNPFGVGQTVTKGMISALARGNLKITDYDNFIQTDAAINKGNSGGALVDVQGRLIGINTAIVSSSGGSQGIGLSIPVNQALKVMDRLVQDGKVIRGFLGLNTVDIKAEQVEFYKLKNQHGALVDFIKPDGPADKAGLKKGDIILKFNQEKVKDGNHLMRLVSFTQPGDKAIVIYQRNQKQQSLEVLIGKQPEKELVKNTGTSTIMKSLLTGVKVTDLTPSLRQRMKVPADLRGAVVEHVDPSSHAAAAGLNKGDIIQEINRNEVGSASEAIKIASEIKGKSILLYVWSNGKSKFISVKPRK